MPAPKEAITNPRTSFIISTIIFLCASRSCWSTHAETGLTVSTIGVSIALLTLHHLPARTPSTMLKKVDYKTLHLLRRSVHRGHRWSGAQRASWSSSPSSLARSAAATSMLMIAIILVGVCRGQRLHRQHPLRCHHDPRHPEPLRQWNRAWHLRHPGLGSGSIGTDVGGSATPIGASANVVGTSAAAKAGHPISWGR